MQDDTITRRIVLAFALICISASGCAGYRFGNASLYRNDIRTIHVPMVRCDSYRAGLGAQFTEVLQKRIEDRTSFKLTDSTTADSTFVCRITNDTKQVYTETRFDDPRDLLIGISVETNWTDRRGNVLMQNRFLPPGESTFLFSEQTHMVPEGGQSITTAELRAMERLADHIVDQMEVRF